MRYHRREEELKSKKEVALLKDEGNRLLCETEVNQEPYKQVQNIFVYLSAINRGGYR